MTSPIPTVRVMAETKCAVIVAIVASVTSNFGCYIVRMG
jgi:hypothetical protein